MCWGMRTRVRANGERGPAHSGGNYNPPGRAKVLPNTVVLGLIKCVGSYEFFIYLFCCLYRGVGIVLDCALYGICALFVL